MRNLTMLTDLYELTMMSGYFAEKKGGELATFDLFFRHTDQVDMCVVAGLQQVIEYINNLHFSDEDLAYLKSLNMFRPDFLEYLKTFRFTGDIYAMREGEIAFPGEPILIVRAPILEAQFVETALLNIINHQTLIATKTAKIVREAGKAGVMEFGARRAQGPDAAIYGARAAVIGGCTSTSNVLSAQLFDLAPAGTLAHSWVMSFESELEAFRAYAKLFPHKCLLLVDTYDTLNSGIPNAIKVFDELKAKGIKPLGIRLDSGDLAYMSKKARVMLDAAGYDDAIICASGDIDEVILASLRAQGAKIDLYGIGTKLITASPISALGGVYKLAELVENGIAVPKIKLSDTGAKITNPCFKTVYRLYVDGMSEADLITLKNEKLDTSVPITIYDQVDRWKTMTLNNYSARELLIQIFKDGQQVYFSPDVDAMREYCKAMQAEFYEEYLRLINPHIYKVDLSDKLYDIKKSLLKSRGK